MDDFRVGSIPSPDPYGNRRPVDPLNRRRQHHHDDEMRDAQDEPEDIFETAEAAEPGSAEAADSIEDYYLPSEPAEE